MEWMKEAFEEVTARELPRFTVKYSGRFKGLNANIRFGHGELTLKMSKEWKGVDEDIQKGLAQHLICKLFKIKKKTMYMSMYEEYLRQASNYAKKGESDPLLIERYRILNEEYFDGLLEMPTMVWGRESYSKLGSYEYATDIVTMSTVLKDNIDMLDYVLYHELLHKKHKFTCAGGKTHHHTPAFRADEALFRVPDAEAVLTRYLRSKRRSRPKPKRKSRSLFSFFRR